MHRFSFPLGRFFFFLVLLLCGALMWGQQALPEKDPKCLQADLLFDAAITSSMKGEMDEAFRLLQIAYALHPSATIAQTIGSLLPETELTVKTRWFETAVAQDPDSEDSLFPLFFLYRRARRLSEARTLIEDFTQRHPQNEEALFYKASLYAETEAYKEAIPILNQLIKSSSEEQVASAAQRLLMAIHLTQGTAEDAAEQIVAQADQAEKDPAKLFATASQLVSIGAYRKALDLLEASPLAREDYPDLITLKATLYMTVGEEDRGIAECQRMLSLPQLTPLEKSSRLQSVMSLDPSSKDNEAKYDLLWEQLASEYPEDEEIQNAYLAYLYQSSQRTQKFVEQLTRMATLFPKREDVALSLMNEYSLREEYSQVDSLAQKWIDNKESPSYNIYMMAGISLQARGETEKAIALMQQGVAQIPSAEEQSPLKAEDKRAIGGLLATLGEAYYADGQKQKAFETFDRSLAFFTEQPWLLNNYAYYLALEERDLEKAEDMAAKAVSLLPKEANSLDTYAYILMLRQNFALAEMYIRQAIDLAPEKASLYDRYAEILLRQEKWKEALLQMEKAEQLESTESRQQLIQEIKSMLQVEP